MRMAARRTIGATVALGALAGGLALGTGIADAETPTCRDGDGVLYTGPADQITDSLCNQALIDSKVLTRYTPPADSSTPSTPDTGSGSGSTGDGSTAGTGTSDTGVVTVPSVVVPLPGSNPVGSITPGGATDAATNPALNPGTNPGANSSSGSVTLAPGSPAAAAAAASGGAAALAVSPATGAPFATDLTGTGLEPMLLASGVYNPGLLFAPGNAPLARSVSSPASAVVSASQVQAMATNLPAGVGVPALIGVVILAGLGGLAVRHRLTRRAAKATALDGT